MNKLTFTPKTELEHFGFKIYKLLVENFSQTFFVGGMVRDLLLHKNINDIDIATAALPEDIAKLLQTNSIAYDDSHKNFGTVFAIQDTMQVEITTLRKDTYSDTRFPQVSFIQSIKEDAKRRDFTINSLYLNGLTGEIHDFTNGIGDIKNKRIEFVGDPRKRIKEDPLRIVRAYRFKETLRFEFANKTEKSLHTMKDELKNISKEKIKKEIEKVSDVKMQNKILKCINIIDIK